MTARLLPPLCLMVLALGAMFPWSVGEGWRFGLQFIPAFATSIWCQRRPSALPPGLVFCVGLAMDIAGHGPLGFWSLIMLMAALAGRLEHGLNDRIGTFGVLALAGLTSMALVMIAFATTSAYLLHLTDWQVFAEAGLLGVAAAPVLMLLIATVEHLLASAPRRHYERRS
jgi:hypothetical protein